MADDPRLLEDIVDADVVEMALMALCRGMANEKFDERNFHEVFGFAQLEIPVVAPPEPTPKEPSRNPLLESVAEPRTPSRRDMVQRLLDAMEAQTYRLRHPSPSS